MNFIKEISINMPQMAIGALSENWLFKEIGNIHWDLICQGLNTRSLDLKDDLGNRLYATFIRIKIHSSSSLLEFNENENLKIEGKIQRFGNSLYHSSLKLNGVARKIKAELLTSFSIRNDDDNSKLVKSQPAGVENSIPEYESLPDFINEYRMAKKGMINDIEHDNLTFRPTDDIVFESNYIINPYYDLNGVGLLYFASYPVINDFCEAQYFNRERKLTDRWEQSYYTVVRDIFYFANCNIDDEIIYKLHSFEFLDEKRIQLCSSLYRKCDNALLARLFSVKEQNSK